MTKTAKKQKLNLPNKLSVLRLCLIPVFMVTFYVEFPCHFLVSCAVFAIAALTDFLDGYFARKYNLVTDFGKFLDASADKVLVLSCLILLMDKDLITSARVPEFIGGVFVSVILAREILVSCLRMITASKGIVLAADKLGKAKTMLQDLAIIILLVAAEFSAQGSFFAPDFNLVVFILGFAMLSVAVIMTIISGVHYVVLYGGKLQGADGKN